MKHVTTTNSPSTVLHLPLNLRKHSSMADMFSGALSFNKPLDHFHVENVEDFTEMFFGADAFNQDISNCDMQSAKYMSHMFGDALAYYSKFRKDLCAWGRRFDTTDW